MHNAAIIKSTAALSLFLMALSGNAHANIVFDQGFENDTAGWLDGNTTWAGNVDRVSSGTNGVTSFDGANHAIFTQTFVDGIGTTGPFTAFDGYRFLFPEGGYLARAAIYLDIDWNVGDGFDYSVASSGTDGFHQRDFIFHVTKDTSTDKLLVGGSNNSNFVPKEDLENGNNYEVEQSGWFIFEHAFRNNNGTLAVDLNLRDSSGGLLFTETRSNAIDTIPDIVGGNRYGWFTNIDVGGGIAVDSTQLELSEVPEPSVLALLAIGLATIVVRQRRRRGEPSFAT